MNEVVAMFGHSHAWNLRNASKRQEFEGFDFQVPVCGTKELTGSLITWNGDGRAQINPIIQRVFNSAIADESNWFVSAVQGNHYNRVGMLCKGKPFDFVLPSYPDFPLREDAAILPFDAVWEAVHEDMAQSELLYRAIGENSYGMRTFVAGPPPPSKDLAVFRTMLKDDKHFDDLASPFTRLKLWYVQNLVYSKICEDTKVRFLSGNLENTRDEHGFLLPEFIKDAVHANWKWSTLYIHELMRVITQIKSEEEVESA